jgi:2-succinyl-5-enolpyruvyl-6-hydroxy-3-cyclohexene-1-carboxylate synthase
MIVQSKLQFQAKSEKISGSPGPKGNEAVAYELVEQLIQQGVEYFCLAPGMRLTPLAVAISAHPKARLFTHFDERALAFHALGYAKASGSPAAIVVTSGTALGNLYPAVMEAYYCHTPLILLTSDRPPEMRETKANQTCDQVKFFGRYVRFAFDLPSGATEFPPRFLRALVAQAVSRAKDLREGGPVQLNCPFPEPFLAEVPADGAREVPCQYEEAQVSASETSLKRIAALLQEHQKGAIVVGALPIGSDFAAVLALAETLKWPILADIASGIRSLGAQEPCIRYWESLLQGEDFAPEFVLHLGDQCVSKKLLQWRNAPLLHVSLHTEPWDPKYQITHRLICDPLRFCQQLLPSVEKRAERDRLDLWLEGAERVDQVVEAWFREEAQLSEIGLFRALLKCASPLFIANSMPIRDADRFFFPAKPIGPLFTNRGLSGIDGNIATCTGIATQTPLIAILGDLAALHDLNALAMLTKSPHPITLIIINNGGGGIFSFTAAHQSEMVREQLLAGSHAYTFEKAAALFEIPYARVKSKEELMPLLGKRCLVEVVTSREENALLHKALEARVASELSQK